MKFVESYLKKCFRTIERNNLVKPKDRIFVALSGGKDSTAALFVLKKYVEEKNIDCKLTAFHLNFGLPVSEKVLKVVEKQANLANVDLLVINLKNEGIDLDKIMKKSKRPICSICGVIKRYMINKIPREKGANKVATGHHADDFISFFLKNFANQNFGWISKFKPFLESEHPKLIAKIRPLFEVGGKENEIFCKKMGIDFIEENVCPRTYYACLIDPSVKIITDWIYEMEKIDKQFRIKMIRAIQKISKNFKMKAEFRECKVCKEPTNQEICAFCKLVK